MSGYEGFQRCDLDADNPLYRGHLPEALLPDTETFERLWDLHPEAYHLIHMHGRQVRTPRWQQAYGTDYHYTGQTNRALSLTPEMVPFLTWSRAHIDERLNGLLFNWYDGSKNHYIGRHRDSTRDMIKGAPIVTISLGEARIFRMRPWPQKAPMMDFIADHGSVFVLPYDTNLSWTHEVPDFKRFSGRRISITLRGFLDGEATG